MYPVSYWDQLRMLGLYFLEKRRELYIIFLCGVSWNVLYLITWEGNCIQLKVHVKHGRKCVVNIERSISVHNKCNPSSQRIEIVCCDAKKLEEPYWLF